MRGVDVHSHLVPAFDDGVRSVDQARTALRALADDGVRTIVTTPHLDASLIQRGEEYHRVMGLMDRGWAALVEMAAAELPELDVHRGVELRLDIPGPDLSDPRLRLAGSRAALVEFDGFTIPLRAEAVLADLADDGWTPVLAHPERYRGASVDRLRPLRDAGALLQVNAGSLLGRYGHDVRALAWRLLDESMVAVIASDYHGHREPLIAGARAAVRDRLGDEAAGLLFETNPRRILDGEAPAAVAVEKAGGGVLGRIAGWLGR